MLERAKAAYTPKKQLEDEYSLYKIAINSYLIHYLFHLDGCKRAGKGQKKELP